MHRYNWLLTLTKMCLLPSVNMLQLAAHAAYLFCCQQSTCWISKIVHNFICLSNIYTFGHVIYLSNYSFITTRKTPMHVINLIFENITDKTYFVRINRYFFLPKYFVHGVKKTRVYSLRRSWKFKFSQWDWNT